MENEHILLLGATGASGLVFIDAVLETTTTRMPKLTLYIRPGSKSKLPASATSNLGNGNIRIVEGHLDDVQALREALSASSSSTNPGSSFQPVTTVISFLGAYLSLKAVFTRDKSHPIADAFQNAVLPTIIKTCNPNASPPRILVLSTPTAFCYSSERKAMPWKWWFYTCIPILFAPQGNAEMKGIAEAVVKAGGGSSAEGAQNQDQDHDQDQQDMQGPGHALRLDWTVFRVPHLTDGDPHAKVIAGNLDQAFAGGTDLRRGSLVRWVLKEIQERKWVRRAPLLANA
ncbi:hypothetical protein H2202_001243 [Exophiala xenobiotica]|nr:hypothetical protein H2202_001243 [Exophiala xenobiotica]KAK5234051.1 hypothetical protein LTR47_004640 [Exophiala xenobiotica]KAK5253122.1 hypothetical protein LTS06_002326 [Exophiala xenobiotica]KAK5352730.1 hypothetical protein LTR61_003856 [Exophiala xenobiotica]KAK5375594.1 hypothetical protein LTR11_005144 [Exophiala xenobiotica]